MLPNQALGIGIYESRMDQSFRASVVCPDLDSLDKLVLDTLKSIVDFDDGQFLSRKMGKRRAGER